MRGFVIAIASLAGCYSPSYQDCAIACPSMSCPAGLSCMNGYCRTSTTGASCADILGDARTNDAVVTCELGLVACGESCFDLSTTEAHCGRCDRDCATTTCNAGHCTTTTVASSIPLPSQLVAGHGVVAYGSGRYGNCPQASSKLVVLRTAGGAGFEVQFACTTALAVTPSTLYLGELPSVRAFALATGVAGGSVTVPNGCYVGAVAASMTDVMIGLHNPDDSVRAAPPQLGASTQIYAQAPRRVNGIVRTPSYVWFENHDDLETFRRINRVAPSGIPSSYLEVTTADGKAELAFGASRVFVAEQAGAGRLRSYLEDGSGLATLVTVSPGIVDVAADDAGVYWAQQTNAGTTFEIRGRRHDTGTIELLATEVEPVTDIAVDGPWVYWLTRTAADVGSLRRTAK